jgi:hypothetical protein
VGVLDDMLDDTGGAGRSAGGFADLIGKAVSQPTSRSAEPTADLGQLTALDDGTLARLLRYLPSEAIVPLLAHAPTALAARVVGMLDAESQAWLAAQSDAIEAVDPTQHAAAVRQALALLPRARAAGPLAAATPPAAPRAPVQVGVAFSSGAVASAVSPPGPVAETGDTTSDELVETLAKLITVAAVGGPQRLADLAHAAEHPVLALGLRRLAAGAEAHALDEELRLAIHDALAMEQRRCELMRQAVLAMRFGEGADSFRAKASACLLYTSDAADDM